MDYTRVTVHGTHRRGDVVLPNDELLVDLMPTLLDLMGESSMQPAAMRLTTLEGQQLEPEEPLVNQPVEDGSLLFLTSLNEVPRPPELSDVTEAVLSERSRRSDVWNQTWARRLTALTAIVAGFLATNKVIDSWTLGVGIGLAAATIALGVIARRTVSWPLPGAAAVVLGGALAWGAHEGQRLALASTHPRVVALMGAVAAAGIVVASLAWGAQQRPLAMGGATAIVAGAGPIIASYAGLSDHAVFPVTAVVIALCLGLIPGVAMALSGLTGLDDQIIDGRGVNRETATDRAHDVFSTLGWLVVAVSLPLAASLWILTTYRTDWAIAVTLTVGITVACRARFLPLTEQVATVWAIEAALVYWLVQAWIVDPRWQAAALVGAVAVVALILILNPPTHVRARIRTVLNLVEQLAVLAMIPVLLGYFGVFSDLLQVYHR